MATVYEAVTPDNKETEIGKVKVKKTITIDEATLAAIKEVNPDFKVPEPEMFRLELIDDELDKLQVQIDEINLQIQDKQTLRKAIEKEAKKVKLKV